MKKAVVIEDNRAIRDLIVRWLVRINYAATGYESYEKWKEEEKCGDLVLCDYDLVSSGGTEFNGPECVERIRKRCPRAIIIGMSGEGGMRRADAFMRAGANSFLAKEVSMKDFIKKLQKKTENIRY